LEDKPLPNLNDPDWQLPDIRTNEAFRAKLRTDFQECTKVTIGSWMGHLQWFIPIHVLIDLIGVFENVRRTPTHMDTIFVTNKTLLTDTTWFIELHKIQATRVGTVDSIAARNLCEKASILSAILELLLWREFK
jgi:hypothetical protein